jgi:hypothetical protein
MDDAEDHRGEVAELLSLDIEVVRRVFPMPLVPVAVEGTTGAQWFGAGDPTVLLVGIGIDRVRVAEPEIRWVGPHSPRLHARGVVELSWPAATADGIDALAAEAQRACAARMSRFSTCSECGELTPPEWLHAPALCDSCAERNHGVVH